MNALRLTTPAPSPRTLIDAAIESHGPVRVLLAAAAALLRPKARPPDMVELTPHLRRDIGLPPPRARPPDVADLPPHAQRAIGLPPVSIVGHLSRFMQ